MNSHPLQRAPKRKTNIPQPIELEEYPPQMDQDIARLQSLIQKNKLKIKKLQKEKQDFIIEAETSESKLRMKVMKPKIQFQKKRLIWKLAKRL